MDHRPFEEWLLEDQTLTIDQKRQLDAHLRKCTSCAALAEVNLALNSTRLAAPAEGFADRFQVRLAARKQSLRRRNFWGFTLLTLSALGLMSWMAWPVLKDMAQSPVNFLVSWMTELVSFVASLEAIFRAGMVLFKVVPGFVPSYIWAVILFAAGGWSMVWVVSLMKFTKVTQGVSR
jgi:hypothetical protein